MKFGKDLDGKKNVADEMYRYRQATWTGQKQNPHWKCRVYTVTEISSNVRLQYSYSLPTGKLPNKTKQKRVVDFRARVAKLASLRSAD
jgi:hypothetical protein